MDQRWYDNPEEENMGQWLLAFVLWILLLALVM